MEDEEEGGRVGGKGIRGENETQEENAISEDIMTPDQTDWCHLISLFQSP